MLDEALCYDPGDEFIRVVDALAALKAKRERQRICEVFYGSGVSLSGASDIARV